jgi:3',5'-cyclic-AMP phosphodiesterase
MRRLLWVIWAVVVLVSSGCARGGDPTPPGRSYQRVVVMSDVHLPGRNLLQKEQALATINGWPDVDLVVVTGDIVATAGDPAQYAAARSFFDRLTHPAAFVGGNHDYIYPDGYPVDPQTGSHLKEASPDLRRQKLERFKATWGLNELFYSRRMAGYLLVFLTADDLYSNHYAQMTGRQLDWLATHLRSHRDLPTIVFFHAPLAGTYASRSITQRKNPDSFNAEPAERIREILRGNPQVFMWVAGHLHIAPSNRDFNSAINRYDGRVWVIHTPDMNGSSLFGVNDAKSTAHATVWTHSLFLYPDRVVVKTYDHARGVWLDAVERVVAPPKLNP